VSELPASIIINPVIPYQELYLTQGKTCGFSKPKNNVDKIIMLFIWAVYGE
jgi:hypothetical protein